jgi:hypothetical protein
MTNRTYSLPHGKVRPQSQRRYVVVRWNAYHGRYVPVYRTDVLDRVANKAHYGDMVIDQVEARFRKYGVTGWTQVAA